MRLIIAEKPSLARAIAAAMPGQHRTTAQHIECATGDVIAWCAGHVLEMAPPEDYSPELKAWTLATLPIVPERWQHRVTRRELVDSIKRLLRKATRVVHAGDPDREGQLLVDEVLLHLDWRGPTDRLLVTDLSPAAVRRALSAIAPNERFRPLYDAALARQRADWLFGINLTRLYTLRARLGGYQGVLSVGRVQTPLLGLIVRRDREIERFVSKPYYGVDATLANAEGTEFKARWAVGKEHESVTDPEGRLLSREVAEAVSRRVARQAALVVTYEQTPHAEPAPLPYSLAELQMDGARKLGLSAAQVLETAQKLYERQLITYPRSDCSHLPEEHFGQAAVVLRAIGKVAPRLEQASAAANAGRRSKAWNDAKITAHHAIIPTAGGNEASLNDSELAVYELVARRYVQQFLPPFEYLAAKAELVLAGETFVARGRQILASGWKAFEKEPPEADDAPSDDQDDAAALPPLRIGQKLFCSGAAATEKQTQPPKPFTDATLIQAMCAVAKYISDPKARQILEDTDGIGTPATRAAIIETLFTRRYVERKKKQIRSTAIGRGLIDALPEVATTPDMTAVWESAMRRINDRQLDLGRFLGAVTGQLGELVRRGKAQGALVLPPTGLGTPQPAKRRRAAGKARRTTSKRATGASRQGARATEP